MFVQACEALGNSRAAWLRFLEGPKIAAKQESFAEKVGEGMELSECGLQSRLSVRVGPLQMRHGSRGLAAARLQEDGPTSFARRSGATLRKKPTCQSRHIRSYIYFRIWYVRAVSQRM